MCAISTIVESLFSDAEFCFVGRDLRLYSCWCPFSTCVSPLGSPVSHCEFTPLTIGLAVAVAVIGTFAVLAYALVSNSLSDLQLASGGVVHRYRDVLFGVYQASSDVGSSSAALDCAHSPRETTELLSSNAPPIVRGGTF